MPVLPVTFHPSSALVVVDIQNDFTDPDGGLAVRDAPAVVPLVNEAVREARQAGSPVVYSQDWHPERTPHFVTDGGPWPVHCVAGTWGAELHPDLEVVADAPVVRKGTGGEDGYSAFSVRDPVSGMTDATELGRILDDHDVRHVVVVGLAGDYCVLETALDGIRLGFKVTVPLAATRFVEVNDGDAARAVARMREAGVAVIEP